MFVLIDDDTGEECGVFETQCAAEEAASDLKYWTVMNLFTSEAASWFYPEDASDVH